MTELSSTNQFASVFQKHFLNEVYYSEMINLQKNKVQEIKGTSKISILGMEFRPVITLGYRAIREQEVVSSAQIDIVPTDRGGFATLHSPGQLVIFPMLDLLSYKMGVKNYVSLLNECTKKLLLTYNIETAFDEKKTGLYTKSGKIAFTGIKVDRGVVRHGLSLNVTNDLNLFKQIRSCGICSQTHDKMANHIDSSKLDLNILFEAWTQIFTESMKPLFS